MKTHQSCVCVCPSDGDAVQLKGTRLEVRLLALFTSTITLFCCLKPITKLASVRFVLKSFSFTLAGTRKV